MSLIGPTADLLPLRHARSNTFARAKSGVYSGRTAAGELSQSSVELLAKHAVSIWRDRDGTAAVDAPDPSPGEAVRTQRRADGARQMWPALAPIEAGPAKN